MNIFDEVDENLFRPLTGTNKRKYVDILALIWDARHHHLAVSYFKKILQIFLARLLVLIGM